MKKKAFEEAGIPVKQISLIQVQPQAIATAPITHVAQETVYIKSEPQLISTIPSTSTTILVPATAEPPGELIVSDVIKDEDIQMATQIRTEDQLNLLANADDTLLSSLASPTTESTEDSIEVKMEDVPSG